MTADKHFTVLFSHNRHDGWSWTLNFSGALQGKVKKGEWRQFEFWMKPEDEDKSGFEDAMERFKLVAADWPPDRNRILVINDDSGGCMLMSIILNRAGLQAQGTQSPAEGLEMLRRKAFDLLILDDMMPEMDGLEVLRIMRADPRWDKLPILVCGGRSDEEFDRQCYVLGADDHLSIVYMTSLFTEHVMRLLAHGRRVIM